MKSYLLYYNPLPRMATEVLDAKWFVTQCEFFGPVYIYSNGNLFNH